MSAREVWPVLIDTTGWEAVGDEAQPIGPAECELRPVYVNSCSRRPYEALFVVRVCGREVVVRLAPVDVQRMFDALYGQNTGEAA